MVDLTTTYLGMRLKNPLAASAGPLTRELANLRRLEDSGASAIVLHSLFEEQIHRESETLDHYLSGPAESFAEALTYLPDLSHYNIGPDGYLEHLRKARQAVDIPVIASLNGVTDSGWIRYAKLMEEAGASAIELNVYYLPTDPGQSGEQVEQMYCDLVRHVKGSVRIPLAVKLGPHFSSIPHMARRLEQAGADALVLFNRFYQPDFDLEALEVTPNLTLSNPYELLLRIHWVAIVYGSIRADLAVTGGVHGAEEVLKAVMAGAKVAMTTSCLLKNGIEYLETILDRLVEWMETHEYQSIDQMRGSMSQQSVPDPSAFERANYMKVLSSYPLRPARFGD